MRGTAAGLLAGLVIAAIAAVAALGSWRSSATSGRAADILARIESQRLRSELTPEFEITCTSKATAAGQADLHIILRGPNGIHGTIKLCRIQYLGDPGDWAFAIWQASHDSYTDAVLLDGSFTPARHSTPPAPSTSPTPATTRNNPANPSRTSAGVH